MGVSKGSEQTPKKLQSLKPPEGTEHLSTDCGNSSEVAASTLNGISSVDCINSCSNRFKSGGKSQLTL